MYLSGSYVKFYKTNTPDTLLYGYVSEVSERIADDGVTVKVHARIGRKRNNREELAYNWYCLDDIRVPPQDLKLGNLIWNNQVVYCSRIPARRVAMGISSATLQLTPTGDIDETQLYPSFDTVVRTEGFKQMLEGEYPSVSEAFSQYTPQAFSRCFSFDPIGLMVKRVLYRGDPVGEATTDKFVIYPAFAWVKDTLERELTKQGVSDEFSVSVAE
jgi:hypothetical protein